MAPSLNPKYLSRYKDILLLIARHGGSDIVRVGGLDESFIHDEIDEASGGDPEALADELEALGPTFVKLGQMLSTRPDIVSPPYIEALSRLQDDVEPFSFAEVEPLVEEELGVRLSKAFESFDARPIAAASLGQVHQARLRDGRRVVVKVQRPDIRRGILDDLEALTELAAFYDRHSDNALCLEDMMTQFRRSLLRELDYREEARNLVALGQNLESYRRISVPQPIDDYCSSRILTMEFVDGEKITDISPLARLEMNGQRYAADLLKAYLDQVLVQGFFHADPHPGNVFMTSPQPDSDCERQVALLDLGMVSRIDETRQEQLLKLIMAISEGRGRDAAMESLELATETEAFERDPYLADIAQLVRRFHDADLERLQIGSIMMEIIRIASGHGLRPCPEVTMLGKTLLNLDQIGRALAPDFNPNPVIRDHVHHLIQHRVLKKLSPTRLFSTMMDASELIQHLPSRLDRVLKQLANREFRIGVDTIDEGRFLDNLHSMINRLSLAVVLAALIIGAALMMRVETQFTLFGYPGLAMVFFLMAAACGFALVIRIYLSDRKN